eukprot:9336319-Alexandrium_andersonii.AAC.1
MAKALGPVPLHSLPHVVPVFRILVPVPPESSNTHVHGMTDRVELMRRGVKNSSQGPDPGGILVNDTGNLAAQRSKLLSSQGRHGAPTERSWKELGSGHPTLDN